MKKIILFCLCFGGSGWLWAQTNVEILGARELSGIKLGGKEYQKLIGQVVLKHNETLMNCDSALIDKESNSFEAYGRVFINEKDSVTLQGHYLKYDGKARKAQMSKQVLMSDGQMTLSTEALEYDLNSKTAYYSSGGHISSENNQLDSRSGTYHAPSKTFGFKNNVVLVNPDYTLTTDTLVYNQATKMSWFHGPTLIRGKDGTVYCENGWYHTYTQKARFSRNAWVLTDSYKISADSMYYGGRTGVDTAFHNIQLVDTVNHLVVRGQKGVYNRISNTGLVSGKPLASVKMENDSLHMAGTRLKSVTDSSGKKSLFVWNHVQLYKTDIQGRCDSLHYSQKDSAIYMHVEPVLWNKQNQMKSDTIRIRMVDSKIEKAWFDQNSLIIEEVDSQLFNQVRGQLITAWFDQNKLDFVLVEGNAENIYFQTEDSLTITSMNYIACSAMTIDLDTANEVESITYRDAPKGTDYPIDRLPPEEDRKLKGFVWLEHLRPKGKEYFEYLGE